MLFQSGLPVLQSKRGVPVVVAVAIARQVALLLVPAVAADLHKPLLTSHQARRSLLRLVLAVLVPLRKAAAMAEDIQLSSVVVRTLFRQEPAVAVAV